MRDKRLIEEMFTQMKGSFRRQIMLMSWGAKNFAMSDGNIKLVKNSEEGTTIDINARCYLRFKVNGLLFKGFVYIAINYNDTYSAYLVKSRQYKGIIKSELVKSIEDLYCDNFVEVIDQAVENAKGEFNY